MPNFTQDWFSSNIPGMNQMLARVPSKKRFLEVGSFEGMSACWFLANHLDPDGLLVCVDTFGGGAEHVVTSFIGVLDRFKANIAEVKKPTQEVRVFESQSHKALAQLIAEEAEFDFIYIDGGHRAHEVISDACMAYHLLKVGGVMVFDDYVWDMERPILDTPKIAVDAFSNLFREQVQIIMLSYQVAVMKVK